MPNFSLLLELFDVFYVTDWKHLKRFLHIDGFGVLIVANVRLSLRLQIFFPHFFGGSV